MNRFWYVVVTGAALSMSTPAFPQDRAVEISISGIGPAVDGAAFQTVRQVIGHAVASGVIDEFLVSGYGIEGGFSACAEAARSTKAHELMDLVRQLRSIHPNPATTAYSVKRTISCVAEDNIACTQEAKVCPDGSFVGRVPPSCNFSPCP